MIIPLIRNINTIDTKLFNLTARKLFFHKIVRGFVALFVQSWHDTIMQ